VRTLGITAGASAPELLVQDLIRKLRQRYAVQVEVLAGIEENVHFRLPPELADRGVPAAAGRPAIQ
jgi:4-hydroxy-3-methylbut-2-en-1-yl diphosphate reductase